MGSGGEGRGQLRRPVHGERLPQVPEDHRAIFIPGKGKGGLLGTETTAAGAGLTGQHPEMWDEERERE